MNTKVCDMKTDDLRKRTVETFEDAADSVRAAGSEAAGAIGNMANDAGEKLDSTAVFVRDFCDGDVLGDLRQKVRRNPVGSLAVAAGFGLLAGFSWRASRR